MSDFSIMRQNMVKRQIMPENVTHLSILDALLIVPRERFVPRQLSHIAYMDADFPFHVDRFLLRPATLARLLQALNPSRVESILYVGAGTGYGPALLSKIGVQVTTLECEEILTQEAERLAVELHLSLVDIVLGPLAEGWERKAPYDKILIEGCVEMIPEPLIAQLKEGGMIVTVKINKKRGTRAVKYLKKQGNLTEIPLFDAFAQRLKDFRKRPSFIF